MAIMARTLDTPRAPRRQPRRDRRRGIEATAPGVAVIVADLTDEADRARVVPEAAEALGGPIEILVNNAAAAM